MDTRSRGDFAEASVLKAFVECGPLVLTPFTRFGPYDLVVETGSRELVRVQVKSGRIRKGCVEFNCYSTDHGNGARSYIGRADVFAVYVQETDQSFIVPVSETQASKLYLRIVDPANNQRARVRFARDYLLEDWATAAREAV